MLDRRCFMSMVFASIAAAGPCSHALAQWPGEAPSRHRGGGRKYDDNSSGGWPGSRSRSRNSVSTGCTFHGSIQSLNMNGQVSRTSGFPPLDELLHPEPASLSASFKVRPGFLFFDDYQGGNALATPDNVGGYGTKHGTVLFGRRLLVEEMQKFAWAWSVIGIMAHEWAHILQFSRSVHKQVPVPRMELQADVLAGWYLAGKAMSLGYDFSLASAFSFFSKGDYAFNDPKHHGTPQQRMQAFSSGYQARFMGQAQDVNQVFQMSASALF